MSEAKSDTVFSQCVCSSERRKERLEGQGYRGGWGTLWRKRPDRKWPPRERGLPQGLCFSLSHRHSLIHRAIMSDYDVCQQICMRMRPIREGLRLLLRAGNARSYNSHQLAWLWKPLHHLALKGSCTCVCLNVCVTLCAWLIYDCLFFPCLTNLYT